MQTFLFLKVANFRKRFHLIILYIMIIFQGDPKIPHNVTIPKSGRSGLPNPRIDA